MKYEGHLRTLLHGGSDHAGTNPARTAGDQNSFFFEQSHFRVVSAAAIIGALKSRVLGRRGVPSPASECHALSPSDVVTDGMTSAQREV
jgi:hypothetical protein